MALQTISSLWFHQEISFNHAVVLTFIFIISIFFMFKQIIGSSSKKLNLPPSPPKLPFIGNLHQLGLRLHQSLHHLSQTYGPLIFLRMGSIPTLVVSSAEMARDIKTNHEIPFGDRPTTTAPKILLYGCVDLAFSPYGEYWRQVRKISVMELFSNKKLQSFKWVREEEISFTIEKIFGSCSVGVPVNIREFAINLTNDIFCRCTFGRKHGGHNGNNNFGEIASKLVRLVATITFGDLCPWLGWMDSFTGSIRKMKKVSKELDSFFDQIIDEHLTDSHHRDPYYTKDYVDILLQIQNDDSGFTRNNIKALLLDVFVAGTETTSTAIEWMFAELIRNPHVMQKVQEEVRRVVGTKKKVDEEDIQQMDYLKLVIRESLRLHPSVALIVMENPSATTVQGYNIPSKTRVLINVWSIQRDPKLWDMPEEFDPERFRNSTLDFKGHDFKYIPFGSGRRSCPGMTTGVAVVEIAMANLLYWFDWKMANNEELDMREGFGFAVNKKTPLHLLPISHFSFLNDV